VWRWLLFVDPQIFWAPGPAVGPGCAPPAPLASICASARVPPRGVALMSSYGCQPAIPHV